MSNSIIERLLGKTTPAPVYEAWEAPDFVNAILGACGDDTQKLSDGLKTLKKGVLKKLYTAVSGQAAPEGADDGGIEDDSELDDEPAPETEGGEGDVSNLDLP